MPHFEEVWQALTTGDGIARWFAPYAAVTPGEGGSVSVGWDPKEMWDTPITMWEPLRRMQTVREMPSKDGRVVRLAVDYHLEVQGGRVRGAPGSLGFRPQRVTSAFAEQGPRVIVYGTSRMGEPCLQTCWCATPLPIRMHDHAPAPIEVISCCMSRFHTVKCV